MDSSKLERANYLNHRIQSISEKKLSLAERIKQEMRAGMGLHNDNFSENEVSEIIDLVGAKFEEKLQPLKDEFNAL